MNGYHDIDEVQAALIDKRLAQTHDFMRDVIDDPRLLTVIPDGSTLLFRDVEIPGHRIRLVAYRLPGPEGRWAARMTGATTANAEDAGHGVMVPASVESGESADAALDAFAELIQTIARIAQAPARRSA
jgi:hypothetical protein